MEKDMMKFLEVNGSNSLVIKAQLKPVGDLDRFQPAGFPEIGAVLYDAPRLEGLSEKVCIIDSPASMANHLETVCFQSPTSLEIHDDLKGLPYIACMTDSNYETKNNQIILSKDDHHKKTVVTSLTEGHRIASDYFLDALLEPVWQVPKEDASAKTKAKESKLLDYWQGIQFRERLRSEFQIQEVKKDKTYYVFPENWWTIYNTLFAYDPNSLVHGVLFAKEQIKISRILSAHLEGLGAKRVSRSGVKFDRLGKTTSGQPIFSVDDITAREIRATFIIDLALLRSYGNDKHGLGLEKKKLLFELCLWKIKRLVTEPFRFRSGCYLQLATLQSDDPSVDVQNLVDLKKTISSCYGQANKVTEVYYPATRLFKVKDQQGDESDQDTGDQQDSQTP